MNRSIITRHDTFAIIIAIILFSIAGSIIGLSIGASNATITTIPRYIICGVCVGGIFGAIVGLLLSWTARQAYALLAARPLSFHTIILGQMAGCLEGMCLGIFHWNLLDTLTGGLIGWVLGTLIGGIASLIARRIRSIIIVSLLQLLIVILGGFLIHAITTCIKQSPLILVLNSILAVCSILGLARMALYGKRRRIPVPNDKESIQRTENGTENGTHLFSAREE